MHISGSASVLHVFPFHFHLDLFPKTLPGRPLQNRIRYHDFMLVRLRTGPLQATLSKLQTYCVLRPIQSPTLSGMGNE